jgi:hypothetical protein
VIFVFLKFLQKSDFCCCPEQQEHGNNPDKAHVQQFVDDHFSPEGSEFEDWDPIDWNADIPLFQKVKVTHRHKIFDLKTKFCS